MAVSDAMDEKELETALVLRVDLGNETGDEDQISLVKESGLPEKLKDGRIVIVAAWDYLKEEYKRYVEESVSGADLQNQAMVKNVKDENGNAILIITSENTDCLMEAAGMLMDEERVTQEKSDTAFVKNGSAELAASLSFPCWY